MNDQTNQSIFHSEVLIHGAPALLPANLSDKWLDTLVQQALRLSDDENSTILPELLKAVLIILAEKTSNPTQKMKNSELLEYLHLYAIELYFEKFTRSNNTLRSLVTLDSILTKESYHRATTLAKALGEPD